MTGRIAGLELQPGAGEGVAEDGGQVVPDLVVVEIVREDGLRHVRLEETVVDPRDLQRDAAALWVPAEGLAVCVPERDGLFGSDGAADGPEVDWVGAQVEHPGAADG